MKIVVMEYNNIFIKMVNCFFFFLSNNQRLRMNNKIEWKNVSKPKKEKNAKKCFWNIKFGNVGTHLLIPLIFVSFVCFVIFLVSFQNLFVTPVIVLNNDGGCPFLLLFLGPLASYVGSIGFLDGLGRLVEFALFVIRQRQVRKIANK